MKVKIFLFLIFCIQSRLFSQEVYIPNQQLVGEMLEYGVDINQDGRIQIWEAEQRKSLSILNYGIDDFTGIEAFINLETFECQGNGLKNINLSKLTKLRKLNISYNNFDSIDLSHNILIDTLIIKKNALKKIDLSKLPNLLYIDASLNSISAIDLSHNLKLKYLNLNFNQISKIDVSNLTSLEVLNLYLNNLNELNINNNPLLTEISVAKTNLKSIDLSHNLNLYSIEISGLDSLSELNLSKQKNITYLNVQQNPILHSVCLYDTAFVIPGYFFKDDSCSWKMNCFENNSIERLLNNNITLFSPNPTNDWIRLHETVKKTEIISLDGKEIISSSKNPLKIDHLNNGIYFIRLTLRNNQIYTSKIYIKKN